LQPRTQQLEQFAKTTAPTAQQLVAGHHSAVFKQAANILCFACQLMSLTSVLEEHSASVSY
jgi:hypothetical protein